jgi:hypothetical protein
LMNQAKNLFFLDDKTMRLSIKKFNKKWIEIDNSNATDNNEKLHYNLTNICANDVFDLYAKISEIDVILAKRARMKTRMKVRMNVWSMISSNQSDFWMFSCRLIFSCKLVLVLFSYVELLIFIRKTRFSSHSKR